MKKFLFIAILAVLLTGCQLEQSRQKQPVDISKINMGLEAEFALQQAFVVYRQAVDEGMDLTSGPCLSNQLYGNADYPQTLWVLDIAHDPRQEVDDLPANQCSAFAAGLANNFIELDAEGHLIRMYSPLLSQEQLDYYNYQDISSESVNQ